MCAHEGKKQSRNTMSSLLPLLENMGNYMKSEGGSRAMRRGEISKTNTTTVDNMDTDCYRFCGTISQ